MRTVITSVILLWLTTLAMAQTRPATPGRSAPTAGRSATSSAAPAGPRRLTIAVIAKGYEDSIVIRWAPANPEAWITTNAAGYQLTRIDLSTPGHPVRSGLGNGLFYPQSQQQMLAGLDTTAEKTKYLTIAEKMLYGKQYSTSRTTPQSFMQQTKNQHGALVLRYAMAMMAADYYPPAADALGLRFVDRQVRPGGKYVYILTCPNKDTRYSIDSATAFVINTRTKAEPVPEGLTAEGADRKVEVRWHRRQTGNFSGYYLERSDDGGATYHPLTKTPYNSTYVPPTGDKKKDSLLARGKNDILRDQQVYEDSLPRNYTNYYYRLRAINGFGELSPYAPPIVVQGRDLTPPIAPRIDSARNITGNQVKIWWQQTKASADLAGYYVERGTSNKGPFSSLSAKMLDKNTHSFVDTTAQPHQANYYVIVAIDTAKNLSASMPVVTYLIDSIPPAAPKGLTGTIDSTGLVQLHWTGNKEDDLLGYQVYASYNPDYQFSQVSHAIVKGSSFTDTVAMNSLDRRIYYKVVALDRSYNHSSFSTVMQLKKPVLIPPSIPVAGKINVKGRTVDIEWLQSHSEGAAGYEIYRKQAGSGWVSVGHLPQDGDRPAVHFIDTSIQINTDYYYAAESLDSSGIRSARSFAVHVRSNALDSLPAINSLQAQWNTKQQTISLKWQYQDTGDYFFIVYRAVDNGTPVPWHSYERTDLSGMDDQIKKGAIYSYAIKIVHRDRKAASVMSRPVQVATSEQ